MFYLYELDDEYKIIKNKTSGTKQICSWLPVIGLPWLDEYRFEDLSCLWKRGSQEHILVRT